MVSALVPWTSYTRAVFHSFPAVTLLRSPRSFWLIFIIRDNHYLTHILSGPKEVGRGIFLNVHIVVENDEIGHGMQIHSLYLCLVICSKNPCSMYLLFRWGNCRWLVPEHAACGWQGWDKKLPCLNSFDILHYSARNSENIDNLWEFLGAACYFHYSPSQDSRQLPRPRESESGLPWHQICGVSCKKSNTPNTH